MITIVTFLWRNGWRPVYGPKHVNVLDKMLKKHMKTPYRFVCITDDSTDINCETFPIWDIPIVNQAKPQNCYVRLKLFEPETQAKLGVFSGDHILSIDLDCVIMNDLSPLMLDKDFIGVRGVAAPINGSMWLLKAGTNRHVWDKWNPETSPDMIANAKHNGKRITGSDQAWMSMNIPNPETWGPEHGVYQYQRLPVNYLKNVKVIFFAGNTKPWSPDCGRFQYPVYENYKSYYF